MAQHHAEVSWARGEQNFLDQRYSRVHHLRFDGGAKIVGSASPHVVAPPMSDASAIDPEEAFVASLAACHMLWFLSISAGRGFRVDHYKDAAVGTMAKNADRKLAITIVTLHPAVCFSGNHRPTREQIVAMHEEAHASCFIANSVRSEVRCQPQFLGDEPT